MSQRPQSPPALRRAANRGGGGPAALPAGRRRRSGVRRGGPSWRTRPGRGQRDDTRSTSAGTRALSAAPVSAQPGPPSRPPIRAALGDGAIRGPSRTRRASRPKASGVSSERLVRRDMGSPFRARECGARDRPGGGPGQGDGARRSARKRVRRGDGGAASDVSFGSISVS